VAKFQVLYWQDVPSLVRAFREDGTPISRRLPDWFQQEIDRRAMAQGLVDSDAYLEQWRWGEPGERPGAAEAVAEQVERELADRGRPGE
jgi:hypothetical protein